MQPMQPDAFLSLAHTPYADNLIINALPNTQVTQRYYPTELGLANLPYQIRRSYNVGLLTNEASILNSSSDLSDLFDRSALLYPSDIFAPSDYNQPETTRARCFMQSLPAQVIPMTESTIKITTKSPAGQVQEVLQYSNIQWKRFLVRRYLDLPAFVTSLTRPPQIITTEEAPGLGTKSAWRDVPAQQQQSLINDVKERLKQEEIPLPGDDLEKAIQWRMPQVFKAHKAKTAGSANLVVEASNESANTTSVSRAQHRFDPKIQPSYLGIPTTFGFNRLHTGTTGHSKPRPPKPRRPKALYMMRASAAVHDNDGTVVSVVVGCYTAPYFDYAKNEGSSQASAEEGAKPRARSVLLITAERAVGLGRGRTRYWDNGRDDPVRLFM
ncbi:hypothetical protein FHL15_005328 [Xylaria flabelliformis]|uniref:Uncharacterized protein n=1 Tax=Xylaria flabelliformis TaxID=2512241 RepID=A0A553I0D0_9PEZI|nr:hypothetical protein FHL15_005328 [Xylaria flabelliformis]